MADCAAGWVRSPNARRRLFHSRAACRPPRTGRRIQSTCGGGRAASIARLREHVYASPARVHAESLHVFGIETEFGFSFGCDLLPRSMGYSENEVLDAIGTVHAAIEIVDSRFADWKGVSAAPKLADNGGNAGIVIGPAYADWRNVDFTQNAVRLLIDGKEAARAAGSRDGIQPLRGLAWLASTYAPRFGGIRQGQVIMTGSCTGITLAHPGASVVADFGSLGQASLVFET